MNGASKNDNPIQEHKTVIYEHKQNDKGWLGGENLNNNLFETQPESISPSETEPQTE